jgi:SH3-like domain-containing protein
MNVSITLRFRRIRYWFATLFILLSSQLVRAEPVCVTIANAKLRKGPGAKHAVDWTVAQYMPLLRLKEQKGWSQVQDLEGKKHWIASTSLTTKYSCAVIKSRSAKLRQGPGSEFPESDYPEAIRYAPFKKVERDGAWLMVQDEYRSGGWVSEDSVWIPVSRTRIAF